MNAGDDPRVRQQYERYPYPERTPADEKTRLVSTCLDDLRVLNHHCSFAESEPRPRTLESADWLLLRRPGACAELTGHQIV